MKFFSFRDENKVRMEVAKDACIGRRYLSQLDDIRTHDIFNCLVTVRYIHKLAISCHCSGCQSIMTGGVCSYVGCRWSQGTQVNLKAWYVLYSIDFGGGFSLVSKCWQHVCSFLHWEHLIGALLKTEARRPWCLSMTIAVDVGWNFRLVSGRYSSSRFFLTKESFYMWAL